MKRVNNKPTVILCFEDFIKSCIIAEKNDLLISNIVSPELVEKFIEIGNIFGFELKITIFDFRIPNLLKHTSKMALSISS